MNLREINCVLKITIIRWSSWDPNNFDNGGGLNFFTGIAALTRRYEASVKMRKKLFSQEEFYGGVEASKTLGLVVYLTSKNFVIRY